MAKALSQSFFNRPTLKVAQDLLGCFLLRRIGQKIIKCKIVEIEAYDGPFDQASHASRGKTERNKVMFGPAGFIYVYFTYGMHYMLNIVTGPKDYPAAVLIRAAEPLNLKITKPKPLSGPAKLTKGLRIDKRFNELPINAKKHELWCEARDKDIKDSQIVKAARIGVDYAGKYKDKKWRFYLKGNQYVSKY